MNDLKNINIKKNLKQLLKSKIGLILSGGGAKGAYQVGIFKAMQELQIDSLVKVVSGTSIGALNGALFVMNDEQVWKETWKNANFENFLTFGDDEQESRSSLSDLQELLNSSIKRLKDEWDKSDNIKDFLLNQNYGIFSQEGLHSVLEDHLDLKKIQESNIELYSCAYNIKTMEPEYFHVNKLEIPNILESLKASSCIPFMYEPVKISGHYYMDGGVQSPLYNNDNVDNVPIKPLLDAGCDIFVVVYLSHDEEIDRSVIPEDTLLLEIYPSRNLDSFKIGSLDFSRSTVESKIDLGYHDGLNILAPIVLKVLFGHDPEQVLESQNRQNEILKEKYGTKKDDDSEDAENEKNK